jgi:hypothetical protein
MDATRPRRTRDRARQAWYARHRQWRFARFLGLLTSSGRAAEQSVSVHFSKDFSEKRTESDWESRVNPAQRARTGTGVGLHPECGDSGSVRCAVISPSGPGARCAQRRDGRNLIERPQLPSEPGRQVSQI